MAALNISTLSCPSCEATPGRIEFHDGTTERCEVCRGEGTHPTCETCGELLAGDDLTERARECFSCWGAKQADECDAERYFAVGGAGL